VSRKQGSGTPEKSRKIRRYQRTFYYLWEIRKYINWRMLNLEDQWRDEICKAPRSSFLPNILTIV